MADMATTLSEHQRRLWEELDYLELSAGYSFLGHLNDYQADKRVHLVLGICATASTTLGAAGILTQTFPFVASLLALAGAVMTGIMSFVKKAESASRSLVASHGCAGIEARARQAKNLKVGVEPDESVSELIANLTSEYGEANAGAGAIKRRSYLKAKRSFEAGERQGRTELELGA